MFAQVDIDAYAARCGVEAELIRAKFPEVLAVTGAHQYEAVVEAVHEAAPPSQGPFIDLVPQIDVKLTPRHYGYLKISEGCNHCLPVLPGSHHHQSEANSTATCHGRAASNGCRSRHACGR